ncbi:transcriptional regulator [Granulicoccus sp. GXG6511]|uniref:transcriptional regulator n=1 Tax=Granulicoccus sp. GXG6511 TaxID=3381351 RepID=UPI003D7CF8B1
MTSPLEEFDPVIHPPKRLAAMALLDASEGADFSFLRDHLHLSDSDLSKQMSTLQAAGYVTIHKSGRGRGSSTSFTITKNGRAAYRRHRRALTALLTQEEASQNL